MWRDIVHHRRSVLLTLLLVRLVDPSHIEGRVPDDVSDWLMYEWYVVGVGPEETTVLPGLHRLENMVIEESILYRSRK